jgi:hypothetical protein
MSEVSAPSTDPPADVRIDPRRYHESVQGKRKPSVRRSAFIWK